MLFETIVGTGLLCPRGTFDCYWDTKRSFLKRDMAHIITREKDNYKNFKKYQKNLKVSLDKLLNRCIMMLEIDDSSKANL